MDLLHPPATLADQKKWAANIDIKSADHAYFQARKLAVRRVVFYGILTAFETIPELSKVEFAFMQNKPSIKDSIHAYGDGDPAAQKKLDKKFNAIMAPIRASVGQDRSTFENLASFFAGDKRVLTRANYAHFIDQIFSADTPHWTADTEATWHSEILDQSTPAGNKPRSGPRL